MNVYKLFIANVAKYHVSHCNDMTLGVTHIAEAMVCKLAH